MSSVFKPTTVSKEQREISTIVFVKLAELGELDDKTISKYPSVFTEWTENWMGRTGAIVREGGKLYRSTVDVTNITQNTRPSEVNSNWSEVS